MFQNKIFLLMFVIFANFLSLKAEDFSFDNQDNSFDTVEIKKISKLKVEDNIFVDGDITLCKKYKDKNGYLDAKPVAKCLVDSIILGVNQSGKNLTNREYLYCLTSLDLMLRGNVILKDNNKDLDKQYEVDELLKPLLKNIVEIKNKARLRDGESESGISREELSRAHWSSVFLAGISNYFPTRYNNIGIVKKRNGFKIPNTKINYRKFLYNIIKDFSLDRKFREAIVESYAFVADNRIAVNTSGDRPNYKQADDEIQELIEFYISDFKIHYDHIDTYAWYNPVDWVKGTARVISNTISYLLSNETLDTALMKYRFNKYKNNEILSRLFNVLAYRGKAFNDEYARIISSNYYKGVFKRSIIVENGETSYYSEYPMTINILASLVSCSIDPLHHSLACENLREVAKVHNLTKAFKNEKSVESLKEFVLQKELASEETVPYITASLYAGTLRVKRILEGFETTIDGKTVFVTEGGLSGAMSIPVQVSKDAWLVLPEYYKQNLEEPFVSEREKDVVGAINGVSATLNTIGELCVGIAEFELAIPVLLKGVSLSAKVAGNIIEGVSEMSFYSKVGFSVAKKIKSMESLATILSANSPVWLTKGIAKVKELNYMLKLRASIGNFIKTSPLLLKFKQGVVISSIFMNSIAVMPKALSVTTKVIPTIEVAASEFKSAKTVFSAFENSVNIASTSEAALSETLLEAGVENPVKYIDALNQSAKTGSSFSVKTSAFGSGIVTTVKMLSNGAENILEIAKNYGDVQVFQYYMKTANAEEIKLAFGIKATGASLSVTDPAIEPIPASLNNYINAMENNYRKYCF